MTTPSLLPAHRLLCLAVMIATTIAAAVASDTTASSLLWEVRWRSAPPNYVIGTIHLPDSAVFRQRDTLFGLMKGAKILYTELDMDEVKDDMMQDPSRLFLPPGSSLRDLYSKEDYTAIRDLVARRLGPMALAALDMMRPPVIAAMLAMSRPQTAPMPMDQYLWNVADTFGLRRRGLERVEDQLSALDSMPPEALTEQARDPVAMDTTMEALVRAYCAEDMGAITTLMLQLDDYGSFSTTILDERNSVMVGRAETDMVAGGVIMAVGAAHLPGPRGVLAQFRERGFTVRPVLGGQRQQWLDLRHGAAAGR